MISLYELFGISEKAGKEEIVNAYKNLATKETDPNKRNQLKIAAEILINPEKRKRYDDDLNKMRAEELIKGVETEEKVEEKTIETGENDNSSNEDQASSNQNSTQDESYKKQMEAMIIEEAKKQLAEKKALEDENTLENANDEDSDESVSLTEDEEEYSDNSGEIQNDLDDESKKQYEEELKKINEKEYQKALKKQEKLQKKQIKKAKIEYQEAYAEAYHEELKKMGYNVKAPWTRKRIKNLVITIVVTVVVIFIAAQIPFVRNTFKELYDTNFVIKAIVDIFNSLLNAIKQTIFSKAGD